MATGATHSFKRYSHLLFPSQQPLVIRVTKKMTNRITTEAIRSGSASIKDAAKFAPRIRPIPAKISAIRNASARLYSLQHLDVQMQPSLSELFIGQYINSPPFM